MSSRIVRSWATRLGRRQARTLARSRERHRSQGDGGDPRTRLRQGCRSVMDLTVVANLGTLVVDATYAPAPSAS
jgi:hypothetical protein